MRCMFGLTIFNKSLNRWNTKKVANMSGMFWKSNQFDRPLNKWNTKKVTNMSYMFRDAKHFNKPLDRWNTENVIDMSCMFSGAEKFDQKIHNWNRNRYKTHTYMMFANTPSLDRHLDWLKPKSRHNSIHKNHHWRQAL